MDDGSELPVEPAAEATFGPRVLPVRGEAVVLDSVVAAAFGVETRAVNQAVKRNAAKFDARHTFRLTKQERDDAAAADGPGRGDRCWPDPASGPGGACGGRNAGPRVRQRGGA